MTTPADRCRRYRRRILEISRQVTAAHVAPAFSCVEIVDALYNEVMRPQDIFIMSKGHGYLAQLVVLEDRGVLPTSALDAYCQFMDPSIVDQPPSLGAHPDYDPAIGIHASTGSLGHGLGIAAGQALAERMKGTDARVYVLLSDGECQEGSTWEAAMVAANLRLDNLCAVVDFNGWGGMDEVEKAHPASTPYPSKFKAFGWWCPPNHFVDGHDNSLDSPMIARLHYGAYTGMPAAVVCKTVKGKGVSFIEQGQPLWHYKSPSKDEYEQAWQELND